MFYFSKTVESTKGFIGQRAMSEMWSLSKITVGSVVNGLEGQS